jgi:hypothetical protein
MQPLCRFFSGTAKQVRAVRPDAVISITRPCERGGVLKLPELHLCPRLANRCRAECCAAMVRKLPDSNAVVESGPDAIMCGCVRILRRMLFSGAAETVTDNC